MKYPDVCLFVFQGLVFIAFGFGLVDGGAILGMPVKSYNPLTWLHKEKPKPKPLSHSASVPSKL